MIDKIENIICKKYGINDDDLFKKTRVEKIVLPRQVFHFICKKYTLYTLDEIANHKGSFSHATVINSIRCIDNLLSYEKIVQRDILEISFEVENIVFSKSLYFDKMKEKLIKDIKQSNSISGINKILLKNIKI